VIVGLDAGQTGIRALRDGHPGERGGGQAEVPGVRRMEGPVGPDDVAGALIGAIAALQELPGGRGAPVAALGVGLSGFELASEADLARIAQRLRAADGVAPDASVAVASDGVTSLLGAFAGARAGVVVAVGTGVVTLGHDGAGAWAKVDGWGALLGDDGSGFAVGHAGLRAALRAYDGRTDSGSALLRAAAEERWGSMEAVPTAVLRDDVATSRVVASFAPAVRDAALAGDPVAQAIWERAGRELARSAAAACGRLFAVGSAVEVAPLGNLWNAGPLLTEPFERELAARWAAARTVAAAGSSLEGALELARPDGPAAVRGLLWRAPFSG
jgi:N-acetylglucosamine kinase-like BadF-type ATPase